MKERTMACYEQELSRPIEFGIFPDHGRAKFYDGLLSIRKMFSLSWLSFCRASWLMLKCWCSNERSEIEFSKLLAAEAWKPTMSETAYLLWRSCFGPWIGSDWTHVSLHTAGDFFRKQLFTGPSHDHPADEEGPPWRHGQRDGWLLLRGPSSEVWFNNWISFLEEKKVRFHWNSKLQKLFSPSEKVESAILTNGLKVTGDSFILAINPFAAAQVIKDSPGLEKADQLNLLEKLVQNGPHVQVSFRIAFGEEIKFPRKREAMVLGNSEFNLTLFPQEQAWKSGEFLGEGIKSLWTGTSCVGTVPGRIHGIPVVRCTKDQCLEEVLDQIYRCESLDHEIRASNGGRGLRDFKLNKITVWYEWEFSPEGIQTSQPKWVNTNLNQLYRPTQKTGISNLKLAGAHTRTSADVWSIEGAVESGRRSASCIDSRVNFITQNRPQVMKILASFDDWLFQRKLPHVLSVVSSLFLIIVIIILFLRYF